MNELPDSERVAHTQDIVTHMTGNPNFTTPNPPLASVQTRIDTANDKMAAAMAAITAARMATQEKRDAIAALMADVAELAMYAELTVHGDEAKLLSAGFELRSPPVPLVQLAAPTGLQCAPGPYPGQLLVRWDGVIGALIYDLQTSIDPNEESSWVSRGTSTKTSAAVNGLTSGEHCWVRVRADGTPGPGPFSDPAAKTVP